MYCQVQNRLRFRVYQVDLCNCHCRALALELEAAKANLAAQLEAERLREEGRKRREDESRLEQKNPVDAFLDILIAGEIENGDMFWNDGFSGVGAGVNVHKLLRTNGHVRCPLNVCI